MKSRDSRLNSKVKIIYKSIGYFILSVIFCENIIFYLVQRNCTWPALDPKNSDSTIESYNEDPVKVMVLTDTHLLGSRTSYWFNIIHRNWQMHRAFQTAVSLHQPELVFILGDITDDGLWCNDAEFQNYVKRFHKLFAVPPETKMYIVVGNHDIGFHHEISPSLNERFISAFNAPAVRLVSERGVHFVLVNSMALEGDGCFLCRPAEQQLQHIGARLNCTKGMEKCQEGQALPTYSRPILMQHFPLFRDSDLVCDSDEVDIAPLPLRAERCRERWDVLSSEASSLLLDTLRPRLALAGHTHHGCRRRLTEHDVLEITLPSFNRMYKHHPNYMLAVFTSNNYATARCEMPKESTVIMLYVLTSAVWLVWMSYKRLTRMFKPYKFTI